MVKMLCEELLMPSFKALCQCVLARLRINMESITVEDTGQRFESWAFQIAS